MPTKMLTLIVFNLILILNNSGIYRKLNFLRLHSILLKIIFHLITFVYSLAAATCNAVAPGKTKFFLKNETTKIPKK